MKTKQKKQFTELSDEELKQVNGGFVPTQMTQIAYLFAYDLCAEGVPDLNGKCPQK